ncbi:MAG TPA: TonB-dependent receptor [Candidatus Acidoferrales bacterium]|nr:TonB-dependent receptor [Candidatus Acidoferrales bacterium]
MLTSGRRAALACACALACLFPPVTAAADDRSEVRGSVTATDGTPIAGATVTLTSPARHETAGTDARGRFTLHHIPPGTYSVSAYAPGYEPIAARVATLGEEHATLTLVLSRATTNSLMTIGEVRAESGQTVSTSAAPTVSISAQPYAAAGQTNVTPMIWSQLSTTPVLPLGGGSNATVSFAVRGPDPTETLVNVDGHQVNNGNTGDFDLSLVDPAALQSVQLIYGIAPSSLLGPNTIGGAINITTLEPTTTPHALVRMFGGSYGSFGSTAQATGSDGRFGFAFSLHGATSLGSVNQTIDAPTPGTGPDYSSKHDYPQQVGSGMYDDSLLGKLRYQLGGDNGYGYIQLDYRGDSVFKDESALLTNYTPPNFGGDTGDAVRAGDALAPASAISDGPWGYQSFAGTTLGATQDNYGLDLQLPLGSQTIDGAPATVLAFSHLSTLNSQSVDGPGLDTLPYLYNQRDDWTDDWLQVDHRFGDGTLSFKYDLGTENLTTDYVQGQVTAQWLQAPPPQVAAVTPDDAASPPNQVQTIDQTQRSAVLRYDGDPTSHIHYSLATYFSDFSIFGTSFDPRAGFVWTPTGDTAVRASVGTTFQAPQLSELVVPPLADRVAVGGVVYVGNPDLQPDRATEYSVGAEHFFGKAGHRLHLTADAYRTNLRAPSNQLVVSPIIPCDPTIVSGPAKPPPCPISSPINAGDGPYQGIDLAAEQEFGPAFRVRAGWDVDSSYLTVIPSNIQDGTLATGLQSLGQPLHKAYVDVEHDVPRGLTYGAELNYEGWYNELNRSPFATLDAHVAYRNAGFEYGLYGTNLTNVYAQPFTIVGGGTIYGAQPGQPVIYPPAYVMQGAKIVFVVTRAI